MSDTDFRKGPPAGYVQPPPPPAIPRKRAAHVIRKAVAKGHLKPANAYRCLHCDQRAVAYWSEDRQSAQPDLAKLSPVCKSCEKRLSVVYSITLQHRRPNV